MAQIKGKQISASSIAASKLDLTDTFNFVSGIVSVATPTAASHAASKSYVDSTVTGGQAGLDFKESVRAASDDDLSNIFSSPSFSYSSGVFTASNNDVVAIALDSVTLSAGDRFLLKNQTNADENGIYTVTQNGDGSSQPAIFTRATDADTSAELSAGAFVFVEAGTINQNRSFVLQATSAGANPVLHTDDLNWIQYSGAGQITAGNGLSKSGDTLNLDVDGLTTIADAVAVTDTIAIYDASATAPRKVALKTGLFDLSYTGHFDTSSSQLRVKFETGGGLGATTNGLKIVTSGLSTSSSISGSTEMVCEVGTALRKISFDDLASGLAGAGLTASTAGGLASLDALVPQLQSGSVSSALSTDGSATGITLSATPSNGVLLVSVNGVGVELAGSTSGDAYFSNDGGTTARALANIASGDQLIWNGASAYTLDTSDIVEIRYHS